MENREYELLTVDEFINLVKAKKSTENIAVQKEFTVETKMLNEENRDILFVSNDGEMDRDRDFIKVNGWKFENFNKNPVFLWSHNSFNPPYNIAYGNVIRSYVKDEKLYQVVRFIDPHKKYPDMKLNEMPKEIQFADLLYKLYRDKNLNAVSVGFNPIDYEFSEKDNEGVIFKEQEMLELSGVPLPANPRAVQQRSFGTSKIHKQYVGIMRDMLKEERKILGEAREPDYEETETTSWQDVGKKMQDFIDGYYIQNPDAEPETEEEIPSTVADMPGPMKEWIARKTLLGDPDAEEFNDLVFFPVVNPKTDNLNEGGLKAVISGRGQSADIPENAYNSAEEVARSLLETEFEMEDQEDSGDMSISKNGTDHQILLGDDGYPLTQLLEEHKHMKQKIDSLTKKKKDGIEDMKYAELIKLEARVKERINKIEKEGEKEETNDEYIGALKFLTQGGKNGN